MITLFKDGIMAFNSLTFIFIFLPLSILLYYISPSKIRNLTLLLLSFLFYGWNSLENLVFLIFSILLNYLIGIILGMDRKHKKTIFTLGISLNIIFLIYFKYTNFILENLKISPMDIILPLGISFFTFQEITYLVAVYRDKNKVNKNPFNLALYISLFTNITSGPILKYDDFLPQLKNRKYNLDNFYYGINRFIIGLGKKVIISNTIGATVDNIFDLVNTGMDMPTAWIGAIGYTLQLYFDFSGYSDMAIGIASLLGIKLPENFNYPLYSNGIGDFWRKWHISLSTFFRDYIYIPLGGSRTGHSTRNIFIVFLISGIWHGANWTFVIWGLWNFLLSFMEKFILKIINLKDNRVLKYINIIITFILVVLGFVIFRADNINDGLLYLKYLFSPVLNTHIPYECKYFLNIDFISISILGLLASTPIFKYLSKKIFTTNRGYIFKDIGILIIFIISISYIISSNYSPFIYFQF